MCASPNFRQVETVLNAPWFACESGFSNTLIVRPVAATDTSVPVVVDTFYRTTQSDAVVFVFHTVVGPSTVLVVTLPLKFFKLVKFTYLLLAIWV